MFEASYQEHIAALVDRTKQKDSFEAPFEETRNAAATFNRAGAEVNIDRVLASIVAGVENTAGVVFRPNDQQTAFLQHFVRRMKVEMLELRQGKVNCNPGEPLLDLIHGFPGTGKSAVISWLRQLLTEGMGWEHGVQFVCLAFQNAMAAQINGFTVHH